MPITRIINTLLIPLILFSSIFWVIYHPGLVPVMLHPILPYVPYATLAILLALAFQFNLFRLFTLSLILGCLYGLAHVYSIKVTAVGPGLWLSWSLPLLFMIVSWLPERGIFTAYGMGFIVLAVAFLALTNQLHELDYMATLVTYKVAAANNIPYITLASFTLAILHQGFRIWLYDNVLDGVLLFVLLTLLWNYLASPINSQTPALLHSLNQLLLIWGLLKHSHDMAYRDELTGLPGRRALNEVLKAPGRKYVVAMMDIDHFKKFNDRYGHDVGDDVLKIVAAKMARVTGGGKAYRYGGEEFTIIFKGKDLPLCIPHLEAVREDIGNYKISLREKTKRPKSSSRGKQQRGRNNSGRKVTVTISIGVAKKTPDRTTEEVIKAADKLLYKAKKAGRNCLKADK